MGEIGKRISQVLYEIVFFIVALFVSAGIGFALPIKLLVRSRPDKVTEMQSYCQTGGPGHAMLALLFTIILMFLFYQARRIIVKKFKK